MDEDLLKAIILGVFMVLIVCVIGHYSISLRNVEVRGSLYCNTGDIDLEFYIDKDHKNLSRINFTGIDGMNCRVDYGAKLPLGAIYLIEGLQ